MRRVLSIAALCLVPALLLSGCWSYRGLSDLALVVGMGVDRDEATGDYRLSSEILDLTKPPKNNAPGSKVVVSTGKTLFDAARNAKRRLLNRLYIGNIQALVIGEDVARTVGIEPLVDWFLREGESRETLNIVLAQGVSAQELLSLPGIDHHISSIEIDRIVSEDHRLTSSTAYIELYRIYDTLKCPGISLTLPVFHIVDNDGESTFESNGIAAFAGDKLVGLLTPEESKFFLIATDQCNGGLLTLDRHGAGAHDITLEIAGSRSKTSFTVRDRRPAFRIEVETDVYLAEVQSEIDVMDAAQIESIEREAGRQLNDAIERLVRKAQSELKSDILGLGRRVYQRDVRLWKQLESNWASIFPTVSVEVSCRVNIKNSAFIKSEEALRS